MSDGDAQTALVGALQTKGTQSKKYTMLLLGLGSLHLVFILSLAAMLKKPELASPISIILPPLLLAIGGMVGIYAGSQSYVEGKLSTGIATKNGG